MTLSVRNPRTGEQDYAIEPLGPAELSTEAAALRDGQREWAALTPAARAAALEHWAGAIDAHTAAIETALAADTGRSGISRVEVRSVVTLLRRWVDLAPRIVAEVESRETATATPAITARTRLVPYPLVGVISPWNFPLILSLIDAIPALAAGSAVIVKPSEVTPRFLRPLRQSLAEVPELAAVVRLIEGDGETGAALVGAVDYVCFTGSVATGRKVAEAAAGAFIPASLELGGKDPMIILATADPERAAATALRASIVNTGQACQSIERIYVDRRIAEAFLAALVRLAREVRLNADDINQGDLGPFIFRPQADIVRAQLEDARKKGATVLTGGNVEDIRGGLYLRPTVLTAVTPEMALMQEETFGPVVPVTIFDTVDEAIALANQSVFGLSASVLAGTVEEAEEVAEQLEAGAVSINDGSLTAMVWEAEKSSFKVSGLGPSRMGEAGLLRFFRKQVLIRQGGTPASIHAFSEEALSE